MDKLQEKILDFIQDKGVTQMSYETFCDERGLRYLDKTSFKEYKKSFNCEFVELCPFCGFESEIKPIFIPQICSYCNCLILPCAICKTKNCADCPLDASLDLMKDGLRK